MTNIKVMLRVTAYIFTCKDITITGQENLFFNFKSGDVQGLGAWAVSSDSFKEAIPQTVQSNPMNEMTLNHPVLTFAYLAYGLRLSLFKVFAERFLS